MAAVESRAVDWPRYLMGFAEHAARKSKDATQVGAALVGPEREVRLTAYNGPPRGVLDSEERRERPTKYLFASHAETNLVAFAAREGIRTQGCTVYVTHAPCAACARTLVQAGVRAVVYGPGSFQGMAEQWAAAEAMFGEAGVTATHLPAMEPYKLVANRFPSPEDRAGIARMERDVRQSRVEEWVQACFGPEAVRPYERAERVVEEALELGQCEGMAGGTIRAAAFSLIEAVWASVDLSARPALQEAVEKLDAAVKTDRIAIMAEAVYAKPAGTPGQEAGGVGTCLLAYCESRGISADGAELSELERITALPPEHFQARHRAKFESGLAIQAPINVGEPR